MHDYAIFGMIFMVPKSEMTSDYIDSNINRVLTF